eukprot:GHVT01084233.1.p1 GENE.GHVT01084233.1~~GHVT01084233.1.p1  ORF type:complete len:354 (+),score=50.71 GHVT01084233.1:1417-2478(+)
MKNLLYFPLLVVCGLALCKSSSRYFVLAQVSLPSPAPNSSPSSSAPTSSLSAYAWPSTYWSTAQNSIFSASAPTSSVEAFSEQDSAHEALSKEAKFSTRSRRKAASILLSKDKTSKKVKGTKANRRAKHLKFLVGGSVTTLAAAAGSGALLWYLLAKKDEQPGDAQPIASASTTAKEISGGDPVSAKAQAEADAQEVPPKQKGKPPTGQEPQADKPGKTGQPAQTGSESTKTAEAATKPEPAKPIPSRSKPGEESTKPSGATGDPIPSRSKPGSQQSEGSLKPPSRTPTEEAGPSSSSRENDDEPIDASSGMDLYKSWTPEERLELFRTLTPEEARTRDSLDHMADVCHGRDY